MCDVLQRKIEEWKKMPRNNMQELSAADDFFDKQLMPLSREQFLRTQKEHKHKDYYGLILTLGTSWQPLALSISLLTPAKVLILCTADTAVLVDRLQEFTGLTQQKCEIVYVDRSSAKDIYAAMRKFYAQYKEAGEIAVDITGGTKAMSSSAAMMAAVLGLDVYYVESKYLPLYRRPEPGSEELKQLANPREM